MHKKFDLGLRLTGLREIATETGRFEGGVTHYALFALPLLARRGMIRFLVLVLGSILATLFMTLVVAWRSGLDD